MKRIALIIFAVIANCQLPIANCNAQSLSPHATPASGGYFSAGGNSLSWTMGETFHKSLQSGNLMLSQGVQQPYIQLRILNLKAFIQGYYRSGGQMAAILYNTGNSTDPTACDSLTIELHHPASPFNLVASVKVILHTDGTVTAKFPSMLPVNSYYIVLRQRNSIATWSKTPFAIGSSASSFDFTKQ